MALTLADFLAARYDEAEALAKALDSERWHAGTDVGDEYNVGVVENGRGHRVARTGVEKMDDGELRAAFISAADPAHRLADIKLKRAILAMHHLPTPEEAAGYTYPEAARFCTFCGPGDEWTAREYEFAGAAWPCATVRQLGTEFGQHLAYKQEWAP